MPANPISVTREECDAVYDHCARMGVPLQANREEGWRVNYDAVQVVLIMLTVAPETP